MGLISNPVPRKRAFYEPSNLGLMSYFAIGRFFKLNKNVRLACANLSRSKKANIV